MRIDPQLSIARPLWERLMRELHSRTEGRHESGAFLLGRKTPHNRCVLSIVYYDELDPHAYRTGVCVLEAPAFGLLWNHCHARGHSVVADVHVHGLGSGQSKSDRENPMIAQAGHLALIFPLLARPPVRRWAIGLYEYLGEHRWRSYGGRHIARVVDIEESP